MKSKNYFDPFGIELLPINSTDNRIKYTNQERNTFTNYGYMYFRFYASSMGRFLKPDNVVPNAFNPQSWNLYSYVNPVNFNDPLGHYGAFAGRSPKPVYMFQMSDADWVNWGAMGSLYSNLYGGNVAFAFASGGSGGGRGSSTQTYTVQYGKWILAAIINISITKNDYPCDVTVYSPQAIWNYISYTIQGEIDISEGKIIPKEIIDKTIITGYIGIWNLIGVLPKSSSHEAWLYQWVLINLYAKFKIGDASQEVAFEEVTFPQVKTGWVPFSTEKGAAIQLAPCGYLPHLVETIGKPLSEHSIYIGKKEKFFQSFN